MRGKERWRPLVNGSAVQRLQRTKKHTKSTPVQGSDRKRGLLARSTLPSSLTVRLGAAVGVAQAHGGAPVQWHREQPPETPSQLQCHLPNRIRVVVDLSHSDHVVIVICTCKSHDIYSVHVPT